MHKGWDVAKRAIWCLTPIGLSIGYFEVFHMPMNSRYSSSCTFFSTMIIWSTWYFVETIWKTAIATKKIKFINVMVSFWCFFLLFVSIKVIKMPMEYVSYKIIIATLGSIIIIPFIFFVKYKFKIGID